MTFNTFSTKANKSVCKQFVCVLLCFVQRRAKIKHLHNAKTKY